MGFLGNWLPALIQSVSSHSRQGQTKAEEGADISACGEPDWHTLAGARFVRMSSMLTSRSSRLTYASLALALEPLRILHGVFLATAGHLDRTKAPVLLNLLWDRTSVLMSVQQYYSSVLCGSAPRLKLVVACAGAEAALSDAEYLLVRRSVLVAAGGFIGTTTVTSIRTTSDGKTLDLQPLATLGTFADLWLQTSDHVSILGICVK